MRFILKTAFFLGLIAFFIPFGDKPREANISAMGAFVGAQQAIADLTGFCDRAPQACDTGRELAVFAGERITDGAALVYSLVQDKVEARDATALAAAGAVTDPVNTGALPASTLPAVAADTALSAGPLPYLPPKRSVTVDAVSEVSAKAEAEPAAAARPRHPGTPAIPTPAPRV